MSSYAIIETEVGLTVTELQDEAHPEDDALRCHGVLVDPGPYPSYEDAFDAMLALDGEDPDDDLG